MFSLCLAELLWLVLPHVSIPDVSWHDWYLLFPTPTVALTLCHLGCYTPLRNSYENHEMHIHKYFHKILGALGYESLLEDYSPISHVMCNFMAIRTCCKLSKSSTHLVNTYWGPTCIALSVRNMMERKWNTLPSWSL